MSSFTNMGFDMPPSGARATDLVELARSYQSMLSELQAHINGNPVSTNVHNIKEYVANSIADLAKLQDVLNRLQGYYTKNEADNKFAQHSELPDLTPYVKHTDIEDMVHTSALNSYLKKSDLSTQQVITDMKADIETINRYLKGEIVSFNGALKSTKYLEGLIHAVEQVQFTDKTFAATIGGSDKVGVYYVLGMLTDKAGTAYIRMGNTKPFSAIVNYAVTPEWKGALSVTTDCELEGLKWKIVAGTDANGGKHVYLAIQSTEWISNFASTDGYGVFTSIQFDGAGINFIPKDSVGYIPYNGSCHDVCDCVMIGPGFAFSQLAVSLLNIRIYKNEKNPYIIKDDIVTPDDIGITSFWNHWDEETGLAIDVPDGWHACDGTNTPEELKERIGDTFPLIDYTIIKVKKLLDIKND